MVVRINKRENPKKTAEKVSKVLSKSKKINWDKYFGKIDFPVDGIAYQKKSRNEWGK